MKNTGAKIHSGFVLAWEALKRCNLLVDVKNLIRQMYREEQAQSYAVAAAAAQAASDARARLPNATVLDALRCEYVHAPDETNTCADGSVSRTAQLTFRWYLRTCAGHEERAKVTARTNN